MLFLVIVSPPYKNTLNNFGKIKEFQNVFILKLKLKLKISYYFFKITKNTLNGVVCFN